MHQMVSSDKKLANAVGGKTARACDSCIRKRAQWYCAADDAFLCQTCDASVHSANPLARRHERVRLKTSSFKQSVENSLPSWQFTRKARTPRQNSKQTFRRTPKSEGSIVENFNPLHLVPEIGADETTSHEDNEEKLLYRVPVFDPFSVQLCLSANSNEAATPTETDVNADAVASYESKAMSFDINSLNGLMLPSDMDLAEFAADVESLLGKGLDEEAFDMEGLGLSDCREKDSNDSSRRVKVEEEEGEEEEVVMCEVNNEIEMMREPFELSFDYESPITWEQDEKVGSGGDMVVVKGDEEEYDDPVGGDENEKKRRKMKILRLDYEGVLAAWDDQRSPWTSGERPELDPNDCWPDCMGACGMTHNPYGDIGIMMGNPAMLDGGREARVSRYKEKRRTRLFSKKIRYEVRKLNAEKRPRMKGRFVKRANFAGSAFPLLSK